VLTKEPTPPEASATGDAQKSSSTEAIVRATRLEDLLHTATQLPMAPLTFAEMHKALGDLHVVSNPLRSMASTQSPRVDSV
jgi:hypothetical protein